MLATYKSNVGAKPKALSFRIAGHANGAGYLVWGEEVDLTADQALHGQSDHGEEEPARSETEQWLLALLKDGSVSSKQIYKDAYECGFTEQQIRRAKTKLHLRVRKTTGGDSHWRWQLPEEKETAGQGAEIMTPLTILTPLAGSGTADRGDEPLVQAEERREEHLTSSLKENGDTGTDGKEVKVVKKVKNSASQPHGAAPPVGADCNLPAPPTAPPPPIPISAAPSYQPPGQGLPIVEWLALHPLPSTLDPVAHFGSHYYTIGSTAFGVWVRSRVMTIKSRPAV